MDNVIEEIRYLKEEKGVEEIEIVDDIFNLDKERVLEFARRIIDGNFNLGFSFPQGIRADKMSRELVDKMVEMGMFRVNYAIESFDPNTQKKIRKNLNLKKNLMLIKDKISVVNNAILDAKQKEFIKTLQTLKLLNDFIKRDRSSIVNIIDKDKKTIERLSNLINSIKASNDY